MMLILRTWLLQIINDFLMIFCVICVFIHPNLKLYGISIVNTELMYWLIGNSWFICTSGYGIFIHILMWFYSENSENLHTRWWNSNVINMHGSIHQICSSLTTMSFTGSKYFTITPQFSMCIKCIGTGSHRNYHKISKQNHHQNRILHKYFTVININLIGIFDITEKSDITVIYKFSLSISGFSLIIN